jgi:hypothetical protein
VNSGVADIDAVGVWDAGIVGVAGNDLDRVGSGMVHDSGGNCNRARESVSVSVWTLLDDEIEPSGGIAPENTQFVITNPSAFELAPSRVNAVPEPLKMQ